jgi:uncharacterized protein (DUF58 family)
MNTQNERLQESSFISLPFTIGRREVSLRPTRYGLLFIVLMAAMLVGSINYGNNLGFLLTFLIAGMGFVTGLHTFGNLVGITIMTCNVESVFAGDAAVFEILVRAGGSRRGAIYFMFGPDRETCQPYDIVVGESNRICVRARAGLRGIFRPGPATVHTEFPLGLFRARCRLRLDLKCLVYPRPISGKLKPSDELNGGAGQDAQAIGSGGDDFQGLRAYIPGDSLQHISWKASSRGQGFYTKDFAATAEPSVFLEWEACPGMDGERKLSVLCHHILASHQDHRTYGLKLPDRVIEPGRGEMHKFRCLEALALFSLPAGGL